MRPSVLGERDHSKACVPESTIFLANKKSYQPLGSFAHSFHKCPLECSRWEAQMHFLEVQDTQEFFPSVFYRKY